MSNAWQAVLLTVAMLAFAWVVAKALDPRRGRAVPQRQTFSLRDHSTRVALSDFLARHFITGDADVRNGLVFAPVPVERLDPLLQLLNYAFNSITETPNAINGDLYYAVKNPGEGTGWSYRCTGIGVSDLSEIVRLVQQIKATSHE